MQRAPGQSQPGQITLEMSIRDVFPCGDPSDPVSYRTRDHETRLQRAHHGHVERATRQLDARILHVAYRDGIAPALDEPGDGSHQRDLAGVMPRQVGVCRDPARDRRRPGRARRQSRPAGCPVAFDEPPECARTVAIREPARHRLMKRILQSDPRPRALGIHQDPRLDRLSGQPADMAPVR